MRPFTSTVKTALVFFAGLIILVELLNCFAFNPTATISSFALPTQPDFTTKEQLTTELIYRDQQMSGCWSKLLVKSGGQPGLVIPRQQTILRLNPTLQWISRKNSLVLPVVAGSGKARSELIHWGASWKGLAELFGLLVTEEYWGYSDSRLWVKLACAYPLKLSGVHFLIPLQEITIIQSFNQHGDGKLRITGWLPCPKPKIPLESIPWPDLTPPENKMEPEPQFTGQARVAIIIDDVGYQQEAADELLKIPARLTWSILPFAPYSETYRVAAKAHNFEVILHLPLEPVDLRQNPGPGAIMRDWTKNQVLQQLNADLKSVPDAVGINNHMGSAGTQDGRLMEIIMEELKQRKLFFVDSMTDVRSVAGKYAGKNQVPFARRQIFIDNEPDRESQKAALRKLLKLAITEGAAIGIAHARPGSAQSIAGILPEFKKAGVEIVPVSDLVK